MTAASSPDWRDLTFRDLVSEEDEEERLDECDWCGNTIGEGERFCSRGCARASESDHA